MSDPYFENDSDDEFEYKSKTQVKREMLALQELGTQLVELSPANLAKIPLPEDVLDAIAVAQRINRKKDGFRRQLQFIGKLMRSQDVEPIQVALAKIKNQHLHANRHFHLLENLRDKLLSGTDDTLEQLLTEYPQLDRQRLRQLKRQAAKQQSANKSPKAARDLFQYLKEQIPE